MLCLIFAFHKRDGFFLCVKSNGKSPPRDRKKALKGSLVVEYSFSVVMQAKSESFLIFATRQKSNLELKIVERLRLRALPGNSAEPNAKKLKARKKAGRVFLLLMDARKTNSNTENEIHHIHIHGRTKDFNQ